MVFYYFAISLTVLANIIYHICQKGISPSAPPLVSMAATYSVALLATVIAIPFFGAGMPVSISFKTLNWASYALGIGIFLLEMGFLLAYRAGWNLSTAALYSNVAVGLLLIPVGMLFFKESLNPSNWVGLGLAVVAMMLMSKR